ncbi:MAG: histidine phosphatase family protein [Clostridia bacterium]|nr:histidine phosphatase family protein [Clostridia bacterium]
MRFLLIRHGQSQGNLDGVFIGQGDSPLTEFGHMQADVTASFIKEHFTPDVVYASDLIRAYDTGLSISDACGIPIISDRRLREIFAGKWEGQSFNTLESDFFDSYSVWRRDIGNAVCPEGESVKMLMERFTEALIDIAEKNDGKTVVIATHATPIRTLMCYSLYKDADRMKDVKWVSNASVTVVDCENHAFFLADADLCAHLGELKSRLPANV